MVVGSVLCADTEANDKLLVDGGGHHVQLARGVYCGEEHLVQLVAADQAKAHQSHLMRTKLINNNTLYNNVLSLIKVAVEFLWNDKKYFYYQLRKFDT